jgi:hypothetical protein
MNVKMPNPEEIKKAQNVPFDEQTVVVKTTLFRTDVSEDKARIIVEIATPRLVHKMTEDFGHTWLCSYRISGIGEKPTVDTITGTNSINAITYAVGLVVSLLNSLPFSDMIIDSTLPYYGLFPIIPTIDHSKETDKITKSPEEIRAKVLDMGKKGQKNQDIIKNARPISKKK